MIIAVFITGCALFFSSAFAVIFGHMESWLIPVNVAGILLALGSLVVAMVSKPKKKDDANG